MPSIPALSLVRNGKVDLCPPTIKLIEARLREHAESVVTAVVTAAHAEKISFKAFEQLLTAEIFVFARAAATLFLALCEERFAPSTTVERGGRRFRPAPRQARNLTTMFGIVRYWRTYMREVGSEDPHGFHPLDLALGLTSERITMTVLALAVRLATKLSFAEARSTLSLFLPSAPSTEVIEQTVLGLGRRTQQWFIDQSPPEGDGDVLVIMIDSKGVPTATAEELRRRRRKRRRRPKGTPSPRHRGRARRARHPKKPRRKKGDKSKNAKMATMLVMYTLNRDGKKLRGPINRRVYASFAPKEHAFIVARREATKRGFGPGSNKTVQIVTDGDNCLAVYRQRYFPQAIHTVDVMHIIEKLWKAGECFFREGSAQLIEWIGIQKLALYDGRIQLIIDELNARIQKPHAKRKKKLGQILRHIEKRVDSMNYGELLAADLEIGSGAVEGAIKNVLGKRCDHGGMRWIKERAEALVQLRCIEINGDWDAFIDRVHDDNRRDALALAQPRRLQTAKPAALPRITRVAA